MGNKLASVSGSQSLQPLALGESLKRRPTDTLASRRGSTESLSTFVSLNSHADECLLKERLSYSMDESVTASRHYEEEETHMDDTSTIVTTLDDPIYSKEGGDTAADLTIQEQLKIPEKLLQKLTTEDWTDIVHFICSSMEHSLQANILKNVNELRDYNTPLSGSNDSIKETTNDTVEMERENISSPKSNVDSVTPKRRSKHRRTHHRPLSMPPMVSTMQQLSVESEMKLLSKKRENHRHSHRRSCHPSRTESKRPCELEEEENGPRITRIRTRSSPNPHKVHFDESQIAPVWKTSSGSSLDEQELSSKCKQFPETQKGYLTLDQLKDLGLSLQQDSSNTTTSERLSSFSMKCWHGDTKNNQHSKKHLKRRQRRKSMRNELGSIEKQKPQFEQLCLLGPNSVHSSCPNPPPPPPLPDNKSSITKDDISADYLSTNHSSRESSSPDVTVEHLHQHNHHHYHHVIHHSFSQPNGFCDDGVVNGYTKPIHYIVTEAKGTT